MTSFLKNWRKGKEDPRLAELKAVKLFQLLTEAELRVMDELLHERSYQKDEVIFQEGDAGLGLFIIIDGRVRAMSQWQQRRDLTLEFCCGDCFGELSLFDDVPRIATAVAQVPSRVVALFRVELNQLLERDRQIASKVLYSLAKTVSCRSRQLVLGEQHLPSV